VRTLVLQTVLSQKTRVAISTKKRASTVSDAQIFYSKKLLRLLKSV